MQRPSRPGGGNVGCLGAYVHIPFCARRCDYCDFATWTDREHLVDAYVDACVTDARRRFADSVPATSVFFGGGTPSLLSADRLVRILDVIPRTSDAEVTVECNPDSVDAAKLRTYHGAGVNRLSFGVQSMAPHVLAALGRTHEPGNVARAVDLARAVGFANLNLDLIYGAAGETRWDWMRTLDATLALEPDHVSAYALGVEPGTPLAGRVADGRTAAPDDDDQATKYDVADERLGDAGLHWYEISNWARTGRECRHNLLYWERGEYRAIGCAAHGHRAGRRSWNVRTPERYIERIKAGLDPAAGGERLGAEMQAEEALTLALRTRGGVPTARKAAPTVADLIALGLLAGAGERVVLTRDGRRLANDVTARLLLAGAAAR
ncbi:MAG: radical SAM family heme chaperone HemW [Acidimicrobiia bacterium]